jgi:hypothetical protein
MTIEEFHELVPEGLHDATLKSLSQDYVKATVSLVADIYSGLIDESKPDRDRIREGELIFEGVHFCMIKSPTGEPIVFSPGGEAILSFEKSTPEDLPQQWKDALPPDTLCYSIFIHRWFSNIHIAAANIQFKWTEPHNK